MEGGRKERIKEKKEDRSAGLPKVKEVDRSGKYIGRNV